MWQTVNFSKGHTHGTKAVGGVNSESQVQSSWSFMFAETQQTNKQKYSCGAGEDLKNYKQKTRMGENEMTIN